MWTPRPITEKQDQFVSPVWKPEEVFCNDAFFFPEWNILLHSVYILSWVEWIFRLDQVSRCVVNLNFFRVEVTRKWEYYTYILKIYIFTRLDSNWKWNGSLRILPPGYLLPSTYKQNNFIYINIYVNFNINSYRDCNEVNKKIWRINS